MLIDRIHTLFQTKYIAHLFFIINIDRITGGRTQGFLFLHTFETVT